MHDYLLDLTVPQNRFTIDGIPTQVRTRILDGNDASLPKIVFKDFNTQKCSYEKAVSIETFAFNGTTLLSPWAVNDRYDLGVQHVKYSQLEGKLLILNFEPGKHYGALEITELLQDRGILNKHGQKVNADKYIILCRTGLMDKILEIVDEQGVPDYDKLKKIQKNRTGLKIEGAKLLAKLDIAHAYLIDNISFETLEDSKKGFVSTQLLMNPNEKERTFAPLVYHIAKTTKQEFKSLIELKNIYVRIELGNILDILLPGYPVSVKLIKKQ